MADITVFFEFAMVNGVDMNYFKEALSSRGKVGFLDALEGFLDDVYHIPNFVVLV